MSKEPQTAQPSAIFWCKSCLNASTRPRITFDSNGVCNACQWSRRKADLDWSARLEQLTSIIQQEKIKGLPFDCIVPVSGGKDGSYVAHQLKSRFGLKPLTITVRPPLELPIGKSNLENFIASGFDHIHISPNPESLRKLNQIGFSDMGFPYYGWLIAIQSAVLRLASQFGVSLIFYGEDGEVEYGGSKKTEDTPFYDSDYMKKIYLEGGYLSSITKLQESGHSSYWFELPENTQNIGLKITHWSYFEEWDSYRNYLVAKENCGLTESDSSNEGTFTNFAQNDQALYGLHAYLMYLKFGFGRATQDAGIEIRRGAMSREQAINLVRLYDGQFPQEHLETYLDYYEMSRAEFGEILDKFTNRNLFDLTAGGPKPKFKVA
jgi:N-acetyl sugar amidotransferase